jgi:hypothetical protein
MTSLEDEVRAGDRARAILEDPLVAGAFAQLEARCLDEWRRSNPTDVALRERMFLTLSVIETVREDFASFVTTGRLARRALVDRAAVDDHKRRSDGQ